MGVSKSQGPYRTQNSSPKGPKYLTIGSWGSILGIIVMVLGRYFIAGFLDPLGRALVMTRRTPKKWTPDL